MGAKRSAQASRVAGRSQSIVGYVILIVGVVWAAYGSSFTGLLVFDDEPAIAANPHIRHLWPLSDAMSAPADTSVSGRPIVSLSLALNYALAPVEVRDVFSASADGSGAAASGLLRNLRGYHSLNLVIHTLAAFALSGIVRRTLVTPPLRDRFGSASAWLAAGVAVLWAVHPLQTGSVTYVIQRAESLMGLFYLLTLYCAIRAFDAGGWSWLTGAVAACALGMATKETMVTAPLIVVAWDFVFGDRAAWRRRWPLYASLAATWALLAVLIAGGHRTHAVGFGFPAWPWWRYLLTQSAVGAHYLRLAIVPWPLVLDYAWPPARSIAVVAPYVILMASLVGLTLWGLARRSPAAFAGAWFFLVLAPSSSVVPIVTEIAAEHRMYLPLAAIVALAVLSAYRVAGARATMFGLAGITTVFAVMTSARNADYSSYERIWLDTIEKQPSNARARTNYASALLLRGDYAGAEPHLRAAIDADPDAAEAHADLGVALCARGNLEEGTRHLERAIALQPDYAAAHRDLGEAYASRGDLGSAATHYARALQLRPDDVALMNRLGWIRATARDDGVRDGVEAVRLAERAARASGRRDVESLDTLAAAYAEVGRFEEAQAVGAEALEQARGRPDRRIVPELEERLALYRAKQKVRQ